MNTDELEELLRKLLATGVTVIVLVVGPTGQIVGTPPDRVPQPPAVGAQADPAPATPDGTASPTPESEATPTPDTTPMPDSAPTPDSALTPDTTPTKTPDATPHAMPLVPSAPETAEPGASPGLIAPRRSEPATPGPDTSSTPAPTRSTPAAADPGPSAEPSDGDPPETTGEPSVPRTGTPPATGEPGAPNDGPAEPDTTAAPPRERVLTVLPDGTWSGGTGSVGSAPGPTGDDPTTDGSGPREGDPGDTGTPEDGDTTGRTGDGTRQEPGDRTGETGDASGTGDGTGDTADGTGERSREDAPDPGEDSGVDTAADTGEDGMTTAGQGVTAAEKLGWGNPVRSDDFTDGTEGWNVYDGPGHAGNGRRTPDAVSVRDGMLTITGDSEGNTAGMAWMPGQKYGRWEGRVKAPASDPSYNALLLLWPDAENFPEGGEVDFMEMMDPTRQKTNLFLHYGADNSQVSGEVNIDATEWHNWAVEWTPQGITAYVDGKQWWKTTDTSILPPGPMHLCIQLDWFPEGGDVEESTMQVDWVKQYAAPEGGSTGGDEEEG